VPRTRSSTLFDLTQDLASDLIDDLIQDIPLVILFLYICLVDKIWGSPIEVPNSMGCGSYKASRVDADIVIAAIASWLAASNKSVIVHKCHLIFVKVLQKNQFCVASRLEVFVLELGSEAAQNFELGVHDCEMLLVS
jgi:hypothetical protein